jgi:uncharacterized protein YheU (UPF0270 family)
MDNDFRQDEEGLDIPYDRIHPDTLRRMIEEFVTREWSDGADSGYTLERKVDQVVRQLKDHRAKILYDSTSGTWNIVPCR